jgi:hypothetical protein
MYISVGDSLPTLYARLGSLESRFPAIDLAGLPTGVADIEVVGPAGKENAIICGGGGTWVRIIDPWSGQWYQVGSAKVGFIDLIVVANGLDDLRVLHTFTTAWPRLTVGDQILMYEGNEVLEVELVGPCKVRVARSVSLPKTYAAGSVGMELLDDGALVVYGDAYSNPDSFDGTYVHYVTAIDIKTMNVVDGWVA